MRWGPVLALLGGALFPGLSYAQPASAPAPAAASTPEPASAADGAPLLVLTGPRDAGQPIFLALGDIARRDGGALVDLRPKALAPPAASLELRRAVAAYQEFEYGSALSHLTAAISEVESSGARGVTPSELSDLYIYLAMVKNAQGDATASWDSFVQAATIEPTRHLDAVRFSPRIVASFERAREQVEKDSPTQLSVIAPEHCKLAIDARPTPLGTASSLRQGTHFVRIDCDGYEAYASTIAVQGATQTLTPELRPLRQPSRDSLIELAAKRGFRHVLWARVSAGQGVVATGIFDLMAADGSSIARTSIAMDDPRTIRSTTMAAVARLLDRLKPVATEVPVVVVRSTPWYRKPWLWATVGVVATSAVLLPFALRSDAATGFSVRPGGDLP